MSHPRHLVVTISRSLIRCHCCTNVVSASTTLSSSSRRQMCAPGSLWKPFTPPVHTDPSSLCSALNTCAEQQAAKDGRRLHAYIVASGLKRYTVVSNHLIDMYGKCGILSDAHLVFDEMFEKNLFSWNILMVSYCKSGLLSDARELFDEIPSRDSVSWNIIISGYGQHGPWEEALRIFVAMRNSNSRFSIDRCSVSSVINVCGNLRFIMNGKELHGLSTKMGFDLHFQVGGALVNMYGKCLHIEEAKSLFDGMSVREQFIWNIMLASYIRSSRVDEAIVFLKEMPVKNLFSWTTIISGCSQHDRNEEALGFFYKLMESGLKLDQVSIVSAMSACTGLLDQDEGSKLHGLILKSGLGTNAFTASVLVSFYAKCGRFEDARNVTESLPLVDDFSYTVLVTEYAKHGQIESAYDIIGTFRVKTLPLCNSLISSYFEVGSCEKAHEIFREMCLDCISGDTFTYGSLLKCCNVLGIGYGKQLHIQIFKVGMNSCVYVGSALIDMYCRFAECTAAEQVFLSIGKPNLILWNAIIHGYGLNNLYLEVINTFRIMKASAFKLDNVTLSCVVDACSCLSALCWGMQIHALAQKLGFESDVVAGSAIVSMYGKCDKIEYASVSFLDIQQHNVVSWTALLGCYVRCGMWHSANIFFNLMPVRNIVSWNTLLSGHAQSGSASEALKLYSQMNKLGISPDHISYISVLSVCCKLLLEEQGKQIHGQAIKTGFYLNERIAGSLNNLYRKIM